MPFRCALCSYTTKYAGHLKQHELYIHCELRTWKCTHSACLFAAKVKVDLNRHLKLHETDPELRKPYRCASKGCEYRAATKTGWSTHVKRRHTLDWTRYFPCPFCSSTFYEKSDLNVHIQGHVKEKSFSCHRCNFKTHTPVSHQECP